MSSTNYIIKFDDISVGGGDTGTSASYRLRDTVGGSAISQSTSTSYEMNPAYREGIYDRVAAFEVFIQDKSSQVAATSLSGKTLVVTNASGFATGDMIAVVQNEGSSQVSAIGKIITIIGTTITLDGIADNGTTPTIDGVTDYAYVMDATSLSLGALSNRIVTTGLIGWQVSADVDGGYDIYIAEDGLLRDSVSGYTIPAVADGAVSEGNSEYGAISSDLSLGASTFDTQDTAFSTSLQQIASRDDATLNSRDFLTLKATSSSTQAIASYSHALSLLYVGDY